MKIRVMVLFSCLALAGCATAVDLASDTPSSRWSFPGGLDKVSTCLVGAMNWQWQPKSGVEQAFGGSISHHAQVIEPGRVVYIAPEHIGPSAGWIFKLQANGGAVIGSATSIKNLGTEDILSRMSRAAETCGGTRLQ